MNLDQLSQKLTTEVVIFIREWLKISSEQETSFYHYRTKLLKMVSRTGATTAQRLMMLCDRSGARVNFDIQEVTSDKVMGEAVARYIFAKLLIGLNAEYSKILEREKDNINSENQSLEREERELSTRLGVH